MKVLRKFALFAVLILAVFFTSCTSASIGKRAIVKALYVDYANGEYEAAIVVLNYEPTSQIAEIKESAEVYSAKDKSLEKALASAEALQSKTPFYAQNELLFLSYGAVQSFNEAISFFSSEDASRQGMAVYITSKSAEDLKKAKKQLPKLIKQCEGDNENSRKIFEIQKPDNGYADVLPVLEYGEKDTDFIGVNKLVCIKDDSVKFEIAKDKTQYVNLLQGNADKIEETGIGKDKLKFKADDVYLTYEIISLPKPTLVVGVKGNIRSLSADGKTPQDKRFAAQYEREINEHINKSCQDLIKRFNKAEIDAFSLKWHFDMYDKNNSNAIYLGSIAPNSNRIQVHADFKII